ncbi:PIN domain-containing protein [Salibacter sp.]|uniref:PIN domain-containing protein n=1 Tax=Salibacter sp. TaxID=2010995 RepID=UPI00286FF59C|nr:PIN domain-containing protein [Salibacter sp.]MDR9398551.1 PIN domain-containing protein [Salibacter sp.]MDR9487619.1 PIN domain-containing protein [Salibacter sp.]
MTRIIVDSNIVFSSIINVESNISQIILTGQKDFEFYAPHYLKTELLDHKEKIKQLKGFNDQNFLEFYTKILKHITLIDHSIIPISDYKEAIELCESIDINDTPFVALSIFLNGTIWTGDKKLKTGLSRKGFSEFITTQELLISLYK